MDAAKVLFRGADALGEGEALKVCLACEPRQNWKQS